MNVVLPTLRRRISPNRSRRHTPVDLIVVHRPVCPYDVAIRVLCDPHHEASAHIVLGPRGREATQLVPWGEKAWACVAYNSRSDNLEIEDRAWTGEDPEALAVAARIVAYRLHKRGLPARWARKGKGRGFCRHYDLGAGGGGHTDPTTSLRTWLRFVFMVKRELRRGGFRPMWGEN